MLQILKKIMFSHNFICLSYLFFCFSLPLVFYLLLNSPFIFSPVRVSPHHLFSCLLSSPCVSSCLLSSLCLSYNHLYFCLLVSPALVTLVIFSPLIISHLLSSCHFSCSLLSTILLSLFLLFLSCTVFFPLLISPLIVFPFVLPWAESQINSRWFLSGPELRLQVSVHYWTLNYLLTSSRMKSRCWIIHTVIRRCEVEKKGEVDAETETVWNTENNMW